jgi:MinD-like ATPase involved in chromosome partitioning or flagellar assembly
MSKLQELRELVQDSIDKGATTVEEIHKQIAGKPFEILEKLAPLEAIAKDAKEFQEKTIGNVYEMIRGLNQKIGEIAAELLEKVEAKSSSAE